MTHYNPQEQQQLEALIPALNQGLSGSDAASIFGNVQGEAQQRIAQQHAANQQMLAAITQAAQGYAQGGGGPQGLESLIGSFGSMYPNLDRPKFQGPLDQLSQSLYPDGASTSPYASGTTGVPSTLGPDDISAIYQQAIQLASPIPATGTQPAQPGLDLHTARMQIVGQMRQQGYPESAIQQAYDAVGAAYQSVPGANINAPLTYSAQQATAAAPPSTSGGTVAPEWTKGLELAAANHSITGTPLPYYQPGPTGGVPSPPYQPTPLGGVSAPFYQPNPMGHPVGR